jgi:hypothetical protein
VLLRSPVDYATTEFDLGLSFDGDKLHLNGQLAYSDFDNDDDVLTWQNPYSSYGSRVAYPEGLGGLGLAPDNEQLSGRLTGHYIFSSKTRLQFDGSYAIASQDQNFLDYTVNDALVVTEPVPNSDYDGEVATGTLKTRLMLRPMAKMNAEIFYKLRDRDYDADRDGYLYVRGDATDQPESAATVYNTNHDLTSQIAGFEVDYHRGGPLHPALSHPALTRLHCQGATAVRRPRRGHLPLGPELLRTAGYRADQRYPRQPALYQPPAANAVLHGQPGAPGDQARRELAAR